MAKKRIQYQATSRVLTIVAIAATQGPLVFSSFSQPPPKVGMPVVLQPQPSFEIGFLGPASTPDRMVFPVFDQPTPINHVPAHLQPQVTYQVGISALPSTTPASLVFSSFSQPPPFSRLPSHLHTQEDRNLTPFPIAKTPISLVFSPSPELKTKPPVQSEPWVQFTVLPEPTPTSGTAFIGFYEFSRPIPARYNFVDQQPSVSFEIVQAPPPPAGGTSRRLDPRLRTGIEAPKRRHAPKGITVLSGPPIPSLRPSPASPQMHTPAEVVDRSLIPEGLLGLEQQALSAIDVADAQAFLDLIDQDEQDAQDIADIISMLDLD